MADKVHISITGVITLSGKKKQFRLILDDTVVDIPVGEALFTPHTN